jgi:protein NrfC
MSDKTDRPPIQATAAAPDPYCDEDEQRAMASSLAPRRRFLIGSGAIGFLAVMRPDFVFGQNVLVIPNSEGFLLVDLAKCQGCSTCMMVCSLAHTGEASYSLSRIQIQQDSFRDWPDDIHIGQCHQCEDAPCVNACPVKPVKANKPNPAFGNVRMIDSDLCIGCERCIRRCPFTPTRLQWNHVTGTSQKCDLCADTPYLGEKGGPGGTQACVKACPVGAIAFTRQMPRENTEESYYANLRGPVWQKLGMTTK